jgi:transcriptional regulator with XRE-family HTH domain
VATSVGAVPDLDHGAGLFPALLKHWRGQRGLSQLDLALAADVSSRHVSFLETGRSRPSAEMVVRLGATLGVPLRHVNAMLEAAGHEPAYDDDRRAVPPSVRLALDLVHRHQEPFPLIVMDRAYTVRELNGGASALLAVLLGSADAVQAAVDGGLNLARFTFDPAGAHPYLVNADDVGRELLWRLQREVLGDPDDGVLRSVLDDVLAMPTVDPGWREVDLSVAAEPTIVVHLRAGDAELRFVTLVTAFQAPQNAAVEDLTIEAWFPADEPTASLMRLLAEGAPPQGLRAST